MLAYQRSSNIADRIINTCGMSISPPVEGGHHACRSCDFCFNTMEGTEWFDPQSLKNVSLRHTTTCVSTHVVYLILCPCAKVYVGMTTRMIKKCLSEHRSRITPKVLAAPMVQHCVQYAHTFNQLKWTILDMVPSPPLRWGGGDRQSILRYKEQRWIYFLRSTAPLGLNTEVEWWTLS